MPIMSQYAKWIKYADVVTRPMLVTISSLDLERITIPGKNPEDKWVASFEEDQRRLTLNATNARFLSEAFGPEPEDIAGNRVVLYGDKGRCGRSMRAV
jgi:hypothetical protein